MVVIAEPTIRTDSRSRILRWMRLSCALALILLAVSQGSPIAAATELHALLPPEAERSQYLACIYALEPLLRDDDHARETIRRCGYLSDLEAGRTEGARLTACINAKAHAKSNRPSASSWALLCAPRRTTTAAAGSQWLSVVSAVARQTSAGPEPELGWAMWWWALSGIDDPENLSQDTLSDARRACDDLLARGVPSRCASLVRTD